jgi:hypothetical protein
MSKRASSAYGRLRPSTSEPASSSTTTAAEATGTSTSASTRPSRRKYTLLLEHSDALMWDELAMQLDRDLGRKIDKSAIVRALVYLAAEDDDLRRQLRETLALDGMTP